MKTLLIASLLICFPALLEAQQPPRPQQAVPYECAPLYLLPVDLHRENVMSDVHGNVWAKFTIRNTGLQYLGFIRNDLFCKLTEGKINPSL